MTEKQTINMEDEFSGLDFNSSRLEKRFIRTMETLFRHPNKSIWFCSENRAEAKAIYRMLGNESFEREEVLRAHREATIKRMVEYGGSILAVQDTCSLNYSSREKMEGIGYNSEKGLGVNIHSCLAVTTDGLVLGVLDQRSYTRDESTSPLSEYKKQLRALEEKESYRWVKTFEASTACLPLGFKVITVCDREGDMYELLEIIDSSQGDSAGHLFLIRVAHNRMTIDNQRIVDALRKRQCMGRVEITIPRDSRKNMKERKGILEIRYDRFDIKRPKLLGRDKTYKDSVAVWVIHAKEEEAPKGSEPIEWFLMTNEPIEDVKAAYERVCYYTQRWKIERFHYVLKSGCEVEKLQERSMDKTTLLVLMYSVISVLILNLTYIARVNPNVPCTVFFEEEEWQVLYCTANRTKKSPENPYSIQEAVTYLGWLGGPKRAPSDGPPGVKTIWVGLDKLYTLLAYREWLV